MFVTEIEFSDGFPSLMPYLIDQGMSPKLCTQFFFDGKKLKFSSPSEPDGFNQLVLNAIQNYNDDPPESRFVKMAPVSGQNIVPKRP